MRGGGQGSDRAGRNERETGIRSERERKSERELRGGRGEEDGEQGMTE